MSVPLLATEPDRLHVREVRSRVEVGERIVVAVLAGGFPVIAEVTLIQQGTRRWLQCPRCHGAKTVLRPASDFALACNTCLHHLCPQQKEKNTRSWSYFDGAVEHQLLRLAASQRRPHIKAATLERLADELTTGDHDRTAAALQHVEAALSVADEALTRERA